jgi:putative restriction endonuclease
VRFTRLANQIRTKDHIEVLRHLLPDRYSPLQANGNGIQSVYLTQVPEPLAEALAGLIGTEAVSLLAESSQQNFMTATQAVNSDVELWEHHLETEVENAALPQTEREALITARRGQGLLKQRVMLIEQRCRITLVDNPAHLVASHCKPWRDASNEERLDGENGLLLTPSIDHLFDRGFISFEDSGVLIISPVAHKASLSRMGVETKTVLNVGGFSEGQRRFLDYHRNSVLLRANR